MSTFLQHTDLDAEVGVCYHNRKVAIHHLVQQLVRQDSDLTTKQAFEKAEQLLAQGIKDIFKEAK